ncbi:MAG TPA: DUF3592 domain-containing protein [Candidatus Thalassarchaeaceae archaeon]|nr:DUF3592 domain-containing protein [Candidatus Thalassarchaeaceae archaeon]
MSEDEAPLFISWLSTLIAAPVGLVFVIIIFGNTAAQLSTSNWDTTIGTIGDYDSFCNYDSEGDCMWEEDVEYLYTVGDENYTNNQVSLGWTEVIYENFYEDFPEEGDEIVVFYNPDWPQEAVLIAGWEGIDPTDMIVFTLGIIIPLIAFISARRKGTISEAYYELRGFVGMARDFQQHARITYDNQQWNGEQWVPIQGHNVQASSNVGKGGLSPSRTKGYNSVIAKLSLDGGHLTEERVKLKLQTELDLSQNDAQKFVESPYVRSVIFPQNSSFDAAAPETDLQNQLISNFQAAMESAMDEQSNSNISTEPLDPNVETCSHTGCNSPMSFYSFQCFSCRKKFCDEHKGSSIHCSDCD